MISIAPLTFDPIGALQFQELLDSVGGPLVRRVSRTATLNANVVINDRGFTHGDRDLSYRFKPVSAEHNAIARRLVEIHPLVTISNEEGVFEAAPYEFDPQPDINTFTFYVKRKLSED